MAYSTAAELQGIIIKINITIVLLQVSQYPVSTPDSLFKDVTFPLF